MTWFLHKKTSAFISKIFVWLSLGIDLSLKGVSGTIPTGDRKWKLVPERVELQAALGSSAKENGTNLWRVKCDYEHILGTRGSWLARCCCACCLTCSQSREQFPDLLRPMDTDYPCFCFEMKFHIPLPL